MSAQDDFQLRMQSRMSTLEATVTLLRARQDDHRLSDAVADIRAVQAEHTSALAQLSAEVAVLTGGFEVATEILRDQGRLLADHGSLLAEILRRLPGDPDLA